MTDVDEITKRARNFVSTDAIRREDILDELFNSGFNTVPADILQEVAETIEDERIDDATETVAPAQISFDRIPTGTEDSDELTPQADDYQDARDEQFTQLGDSMVWRATDGTIIGSRENVIVFQRPDGAIVGRNINTGTERIISEP